MVSDNSSSTAHPGNPKRPYEVTLFMLVAMISVTMNLRVFFIIITGSGVPRRRLRPVNILVAHLSSVALCYTFILILYVVEKWSLVNLSGPGICEVLSFLRNAVYSAFPWNVVSIIYERIRSFRITLERLLVFRTICLIWIIASVGSLPAIFMVEYKMDLSTKLGTCKQIPLFGGFGPTLAYELFRFGLYHALVVGYMVYALFKIRSKIRYLFILKPIPNERMKRKVQRVRYVYLHSIVFMLLWLPSGLLLCSYKTMSRKGFILSSLKIYLKILIFLTCAFLILSPLIYVFLHEDITAFQFFFGSSCHKRAEGKTGEDNGLNNNEARIEGSTCAFAGEGTEPQSQSANVSQEQKESICKTRKKYSKHRDREISSFGKQGINGTKIGIIRIRPDLVELSEISRISTVGVTGTSDESGFSSEPKQQTQKGVGQSPPSTLPNPKLDVPVWKLGNKSMTNATILTIEDGNFHSKYSCSPVLREVRVAVQVHEKLNQETLL